MNPRITQLEEKIKQADLLYWEKGSPEISDIEYDKLVRELERLDPSNPLIPEIHSEKVASTGKVKHLHPMLSLNKCYTREELIKWCEKVARSENEIFLLQFKFDGSSAEYYNGVLSTRGDGLIGENITDKIPLLHFINKDPDYQRGEIVLSKNSFEYYKSILKKKDGTPYSNPRNAAAGILNRDDNDGIPEAIMAFVPFDYISKSLTLKDIQNIDLDFYIDKAQNSNFPTDGLVFKLADEEYRESLGVTQHHARGEIAFKFANNTGTTVLKGITWSCGKETITPIGNVEPVEIGNVIIQNVSLHNMQYIIDMRIKIGDTLEIERAGDVIPHVVCAIPGKNRTTIELKTCPECGADVKYEPPVIKCTNPDCFGNNLNQFYDAVRRIGIDRLGKPTLRELMKVGVTNLVELFNMPYAILLQLPRFGNKKADNLFEEIRKVRKSGVYEWQILSAMNIPGIGTTLSKTLCAEYGLKGLIHICMKDYSNKALITIEGIEEKRANDIINGVLDNTHYIEELMNILLIKNEAKEESTNLPTVCFSGKFPKKKAYYYEKLKGKYQIMDKVDKTTNILVVADPSVGSSKQKKAEKMGIKIMSIDEIMGV